MDDEVVGQLIEAAGESLVDQGVRGTLRDAIGFLGKLMGTPVAEVAGIVEDRIKLYRVLNLLKLCESAAAKLRKRGYSNEAITDVLPLKVALPLLENATLEENGELQELWARLLANAMDPEFEVNVRRRHVSTLREMEPLDVRILARCNTTIRARFRNLPIDDVHFLRSQIAGDLGLPEKEVEISIRNLIRLGCVSPGFVRLSAMATNVGGHQFNPSAYAGTERFALTILGSELCEAAMSDGST